MNAEVLAPIAVVAAAAVSGFVAWKKARRSTSGAIDTSEAATLWDEGTIMRQELRAEVASLKAQLIEAVTAITALNRDVALSREETALARKETQQSRYETLQLMKQIAGLHVDTRNVLQDTQHVLEEVKTGNGLTIGGLADNAETRRILDLPEGDRTLAEREHLTTAGSRLPEGQRAKQGQIEQEKKP